MVQYLGLLLHCTFPPYVCDPCTPEKRNADLAWDLSGTEGIPSALCVSYLRMSDGYRADAGVHSVPGPGRQHAGEQRVQISSSQPAAVTLHAGHVAFDQRHPQAAVVQAEIRLQGLQTERERLGLTGLFFLFRKGLL